MANWFSIRTVDFLSCHRITGLVSCLLIILSIVIFVVRGKSAFSVDFTGGSAVTFNYQEEISSNKIGEALRSNGFKDARIAYKSSAQQNTRLLEVVLGGSISKDIDIKAEIKKILNANFPEAKYGQGTTKTIGGLVGKQFTKQALFAAIWALVGIIVYITLRFEFGYALGAVAALSHDVVICIGIFLAANIGERQLSLPVIAALLTIMGYSLNDTIVVFDRIRENIALLKNKSYEEIVTLSLNQTFSRTLLTSLTTLLVVVVLYLFGGGAINDFALVMMVGVIVGTYSSIFIATPVMMHWHKKKEREKSLATTSPGLKESTA